MRPLSDKQKLKCERSSGVIAPCKYQALITTQRFQNHQLAFIGVDTKSISVFGALCCLLFRWFPFSEKDGRKVDFLWERISEIPWDTDWEQSCPKAPLLESRKQGITTQRTLENIFLVNSWCLILSFLSRHCLKVSSPAEWHWKGITLPA